jgi:nitrite reductase/ring-hydroxylating ferredoxin subunit
MSDIASRALLAPSHSQFPVAWYFDEKLFEMEKKLIFDAGPGYVGHERMVPELYNYRSTEWTDHSHLIVRQPDGLYQMSNVCRHRQAIMLQGSGTAQNIVCPIHRWTYDTRDELGSLIGAPHFPANPCLNLNKTKLENWNGLLFKGPCHVDGLMRLPLVWRPAPSAAVAPAPGCSRRPSKPGRKIRTQNLTGCRLLSYQEKHVRRAEAPPAQTAARVISRSGNCKNTRENSHKRPSRREPRPAGPALGTNRC